MKNIHFENFDKNTLDNLLEGFQLISYDWKYMYVNDAVVKQSRYTKKEDLLGHTMMEKYPGIEKTEMFKSLELCMKKRIPVELENEFEFPDKSKGWFELRIEPVKEGIFILSIDITKRKQAEADTFKYIEGLEKMLFMASHKVRQPVANILGVSNMLDLNEISHDDLQKVVRHMKNSVDTLDTFTQELTTFIHDLKPRTRDESSGFR